MSLRTHAVVVQPDQWSGAPAELARLLAPITGVDVAPLTDALSRGAMTVEADLSPEDARALLERLAQMGVPAEIQPPTPRRGTAVGVVPGGIALEPARITDEVPRTRRNTQMGHKPMVTGDADDDDGGWGAVFPDLASKPASEPTPPKPTPPPPTPAPTAATAPSLDELEGTPAPTPAPLSAAMLFEEDSEPHQPATPAPPPRSMAKPPLKPEGFDAARLAALLPEDEGEQPPYKPTGFDPRPEHHPPFAAMFAILAPGAGHVFNGDDEEGLSIALRFWMIAPWIKSVREAHDRAERIRTWWAPRPEDGSGLRAFRFVGAWWICVALISASLAWGIPAVLRAIDSSEPVPDGPTAAQITSAMESARTGSLGARVAALDALEEASKDLIADAQYTMTDEERAERLFAIGLVECRGRSFSMCEAMMKRVLELKPAFRPALKLQAWASVSRNGRPAPMPDVGDFATLSELELSKMRDEMILEGEDVPPPPDPSTFANDDADMGTPSADAGTGSDAEPPP